MKVNVKNFLYAVGKLIGGQASTQQNKIVLICNYGRGYLCNPKYIAEAINRLYPGKYDLVLLVNDLDPEIPPYIRQVKRKSLQAQHEFATARFWIDNARTPKYVKKRDDQVYIHTWHASLWPKRTERDAEQHLDPSYVDNAKRDGAITDLMFANNALAERLYKTTFWFDGPVIRCGAPRNRPLVLDDDETKAKVRKALGVPEGAALCVYAPTFRADWSMDEYRFDFDALTNALSERFGRRFVFAYRLHPNIAKLDRPDFLRGRIDATGYIDTQELLAATDVLVSDYSSILEDFALTGRPGFVYAPDYDAYMDDRGLNYSLDDRPFPVAKTEAQLIENARNFDEESYRKDVNRFFKMVDLQDDGHGDEVIARIIHKLTEPGTTVGGVLGR